MCIHRTAPQADISSIRGKVATARAPHERAGAEGGFTLLEVIVGIALIVMLIGGVYGIADGAIKLTSTMSELRVSETRITNFIGQWREYLETLPSGTRLTSGSSKSRFGGAGRILFEGNSVPFAWHRVVRLSDAVEFALVRDDGAPGGRLVVRHLKRPERAIQPDDYDVTAELDLLDGLAQFDWQFFDPAEKKWVASWDARERPQLPLFMRLEFRFADDARVQEQVFWLANDLVEAGAPGPGPGAGPPTENEGGPTQ